MKLDGAEQNWTGVDEIGPDCKDWTGLHVSGLSWTCLDSTALHPTRLICTELHCTSPNETEQDCTVLHVNVLHWTRPHRRASHSTGRNLEGLFWIA